MLSPSPRGAALNEHSPPQPSCLDPRRPPNARGTRNTRTLYSGILAGFCAFTLTACSQHYNNGRALELHSRFEESLIAYHEAVLEDPDDSIYREAWERVSRKVAEENLATYRRYLAAKELRKAYARLSDALRQYPEHTEVQAEMRKWLRVLVVGRIHLLQGLPPALTQGSQRTRVIVRLNTPNPGITLDAEMDPQSGLFLGQDLIYEPRLRSPALYTLNAVLVRLEPYTQSAASVLAQEQRALVDFRVPALRTLLGSVSEPNESAATSIPVHRRRLAERTRAEPMLSPRDPHMNPSYSLEVRGEEISVSASDQGSVFLPRLLYLNMKDRRALVDFGVYRLERTPLGQSWRIGRASLAQVEYFQRFERNVALQTYLFHRGTPYRYRLP